MKRFVVAIFAVVLMLTIFPLTTAARPGTGPDDPEFMEQLISFWSQVQVHPEYQKYPYHALAFSQNNGMLILSETPTLKKGDSFVYIRGLVKSSSELTTMRLEEPKSDIFHSIYNANSFNHMVRIGLGIGSNGNQVGFNDFWYLLSQYTNITFQNQESLTNTLDYQWIIDLELQPNLNTAQLESLIAQAETLDQSKYTPETWSVLASALSDAKSLLDSSSKIQAEVDAMCTRLQSAINGLALIPELPDTTELRQVLGEAKAIEDVGYTAYSWSRLQTAIVQGDQLLAKSYYTASEVSIATMNLRTGIDGLEIYSPVDPGDHRYLVDGIRPEDLFPAEDAIMQNFREASKFGIFAFALMFVVFVVVRILKSIIGFEVVGSTEQIDMATRHSFNFGRSQNWKYFVPRHHRGRGPSSKDLDPTGKDV